MNKEILNAAFLELKDAIMEYLALSNAPLAKQLLIRYDDIVDQLTAHHEAAAAAAAKAEDTNPKAEKLS